MCNKWTKEWAICQSLSSGTLDILINSSLSLGEVVWWSMGKCVHFGLGFENQRKRQASMTTRMMLNVISFFTPTSSTWCFHCTYAKIYMYIYYIYKHPKNVPSHEMRYCKRKSHNNQSQNSHRAGDSNDLTTRSFSYLLLQLFWCFRMWEHQNIQNASHFNVQNNPPF